jgi:hypothetical protein
VTAFSIEPRNAKFGAKSPNNKVNRPIEGLMTTYGYVLPNPDIPNRMSVWFTGGSIEVDSDVRRWKDVFDPRALRKRKIKEKARVFGAKVVMGATPSENMEEDGKMTYKLNRPIGGHDKAYIDVLYLDHTLRIARCKFYVHVFARKRGLNYLLPVCLNLFP